MTHRFRQKIAYVGVAAALSITALLASTADAAEVEAGCSQRFETSPWNGRDLDVPNVVGRPLAEAIEQIVDANQSCMVMNNVPGAVDPKAILVARQQLRSLSVPDGSVPVVGLWLGVVLPDLTGQMLAAATDVVSHLGLVTRSSPRNALPQWTVVRQTPTAGAYGVFGAPVILVLKEPAKPVPVPDLVGHTEDEANDLIKEAGLVYVARIIKAGERPGRVVSQQPHPGELVAAGTRVIADIAREPAVEGVVVPDVVGLDETRARSAIEAVDLVFDPRIVQDGPGLGQIVWQSPSKGRRVPLGTAVTVNIERPPIGHGRVRTVVPDLTGRQEPAARQAIASARLRFQSQVVRPGPAKVGTVLNQRPLAGTEVDVGSVVTVDLTREAKLQLVPVPDLIDQSEAEARAAVERVQLVFVMSGADNPSGHSGHVVGQTPHAGAMVPAGATVTVKLADDETVSWIVPLLFGVGLAAAWVVRRLQQRRRAKHPRSPSIVHADARPLGWTNTRIEESGPAHRIRILPRLDRGQQHLREEQADERL